MDILEGSELEEMLNRISNIRLLLIAAKRRLEQEMDIVEQWLKVLEFRLRYKEETDGED